MRKSIIATVAFAAVLAASTPAAAAPRAPRPTPVIDKLVVVLRSFGIRLHAEPIVPIPAPTTNTGTGK
jgi:hypothetical protein